QEITSLPMEYIHLIFDALQQQGIFVPLQDKFTPDESLVQEILVSGGLSIIENDVIHFLWFSETGDVIPVERKSGFIKKFLQIHPVYANSIHPRWHGKYQHEIIQDALKQGRTINYFNDIVEVQAEKIIQ